MKHNRSGGGVRCLASLLAVATALGGPAGADDSPVRQRRILVCGKQTAIVAFSPEHPEGAIEWSYPVNAREGWVLPDGNVLLAVGKGSRLSSDNVVAGGAAIEISRGLEGADPSADRVVWRYDGTQAEANSIQKTVEGTYVLTEAGPNPRRAHQWQSRGGVQC